MHILQAMTKGNTMRMKLIGTLIFATLSIASAPAHAIVQGGCTEPVFPTSTFPKLR